MLWCLRNVVHGEGVQLRWCSKRSVGRRGELDDLCNCIDVDGAIYMGEERFAWQGGRAVVVRGWLPFQWAGMKLGVDALQQHVVRTCVVLVGNANHLVLGRTVDETFTVQ